MEADASTQLEAKFRAMPPVVAMQASIVGLEADCLRMRAPLGANVNDKDSAFGGSLASLMTLCGWGLVTQRLQELDVVAEVFVADSQVRYLSPLHADLAAEARLAEGESWDSFICTLSKRGRARIGLQAKVALPDGGVAAEMAARFVAIAKR
jgi:thioesterase domain-containing protein